MSTKHIVLMTLGAVGILWLAFKQRAKPFSDFANDLTDIGMNIGGDAVKSIKLLASESFWNDISAGVRAGWIPFNSPETQWSELNLPETIVNRRTALKNDPAFRANEVQEYRRAVLSGNFVLAQEIYEDFEAIDMVSTLTADARLQIQVQLRDDPTFATRYAAQYVKAVQANNRAKARQIEDDFSEVGLLVSNYIKLPSAA